MRLDSQKKKILIVASPWLGGSGSVAFRIGEELKSKFRVHFLSYQIPFKSEFDGNKIIFHKVSPFSYPLFPFPIYELALAEKIIETVIKNKIDVVHTHYGILFGHATIIARSVLKRTHPNVKFIVTFHGSDAIGFDLEHPGSIVPIHLNRWVIKSADNITVASKNLSNQLKDIYGVRRKVNIIPNFINLNKFKPKNKSFNHFVITHASNFRKVKRTEVVIKIYEKILKTYPNSELNLIGEGPDLKKLKKIVRKRKIPSVNFLGVILNENEIINIYQKSHLVLLPSIYENHPLVALEAQACGIPVVASKVGGIPEVIPDKVSGFLINPNNLKGFVEKSLYLLSDYGVWKSFSDNSYINAQRFSKDKIITQYTNLYNH